MADETIKAKVDQFIVEQIDGVPHLEALLLLWNSRPKVWTTDEMARSLYVRTEHAAPILESLVQRNLIVEHSPGHYSYNFHDSTTTELIQAVDSTYRRELVRISSLIHSKASAGVRDFARAFRFKKDKD